jgi:hypothetical protein
VDHGPAFGDGFIPGFIEFAKVRGAIVSPLALGVVVIEEPGKAGPGAGGGPLEHLQIAADELPKVGNDLG